METTNTTNRMIRNDEVARAILDAALYADGLFEPYGDLVTFAAQTYIDQRGWGDFVIGYGLQGWLDHAETAVEDLLYAGCLLRDGERYGVRDRKKATDRFNHALKYPDHARALSEVYWASADTQ